MKSVQHHIRKQFLDFDFSSKSEALQWQQKVSFQHQQEYAKTIAAVLDKYDDGNYIEIDKITINLGTIKEENIALRLNEELDKALKKIIQSNVETAIPRISKSTSDVTEVLIGKRTKNEVVHVFLYFISEGHFPWNITPVSIPKLEEQLLQQFSISDLVVVLQTEKVLDAHWQKARLFNQFSGSFVQDIVVQYFESELLILYQIARFCEAEFKKPLFEMHFTISSENEIRNAVTEWILLYAPKNLKTWTQKFSKWYLDENCISEILNFNQELWKVLKAGIAKNSIQNTDEILKKVFAYLKNKAELQNSRLESSKEENNKLPSKSKAKSNTTNHVDFEETNGDESKILDEFDARNETLDSNKNDVEVSQTSKENSKLPATKNLESKDVFDVESNSGDLEKELPKTNQNDNTYSSDKDLRSIEESTKELKKDTEVSEKANASKDEVKNNEDSINGVNKVNASQELDNLIIAEVSQEDSGSESSFDTTNQKEFYTTVEETIDIFLSPEKNFNRSEQNMSILPVDSYYINDSGIVLIWPYLSRLFKNLKYTSESKFVSKQQQERAVLLLGYIATGKHSCGEHELVFSKFLCNWPFRMPVISEFEPTSEEQEEVKSMLSGLIAHWSILKNTSIEGLRETFFWREGKLEEKEEHWKLVIEQKGTDILLSHLPYGISMIKLLWHKKMLRVDWA